MSTIRTAAFRLLGPVEIVDTTGSPAPIRSARVRALAAALLLDARQRVGADRLIGLLWEDPPASAAANLRNHVTVFRRSLGDAPGRGERLTTYRGGGAGAPTAYRLDVADDDLDVAAFRRLAAHGGQALRRGEAGRAAESLDRALGLWRGPAGVDIAGSRRLRLRFDALNEQYLLVREQSLAARIGTGDPAAVIAELRELLAVHPLRERCWGYLVHALYLAGDVAAALGAYRQARTALGDELGVEPSPWLHRLHLAVLRGDESPLHREPVASSHREPVAPR